jgi:hypothetical protein
MKTYEIVKVQLQVFDLRTEQRWVVSYTTLQLYSTAKQL